jgi:hypothetical protein
MSREHGPRISANPVRDLFDVCAHGYSVRLTCRGCRRSRILRAHALWWLFERKSWPDWLRDVPGHFKCRVCARRRPRLDLVNEPADDESLPMPGEQVWKQALRRRR